MSLLTTIENAFVTTESDVKGLILKAKTGIEVAVPHIEAALKWVADNASTIDADVQEILSIGKLLGVTNDPRVAAAAADLSVASTAFTAFATANNGKPTIETVVNGYVAVKQVQAALASATAASVAAAPVAAPVATPAPVAPAAA